MMMEAKKVPDLRFEEFSDEWNQRKFGDLVRRLSAVQMSSPSLPGVEYEDVIASEGLLNKDIRKKNPSKRGIMFDGGQVLYGKLRPYLHNWLNPGFKGVAIGDWWVLSPVEIDQTFLYTLIQTRKFDDVANISTGSKMPRADWNLVAGTSFGIPASRVEQSKIGSLFSGLDTALTFYKGKYAKLIALKKSMLGKMFPQGGSKVPELRFKGFIGDWNHSKLAELATFSKGVGYSKFDLQDSGTPIILYGRLYTNYETVISDVNTYALAHADSIYSEGGEVIVPASGETAEDISIASVIEKPGILLGSDLNVIHPINNIFPVFLALSISYGEPHKEMARRAQGKSVVHLHNSDLADIELLYPSISEQKKIGVFFIKLDQLIDFHQRIVEKLQSIKKFMLEKMFI